MRKLLSILLVLGMLLSLAPLALASQEAVIDEPEIIAADSGALPAVTEPVPEIAEAESVPGEPAEALWLDGGITYLASSLSDNQEITFPADAVLKMDTDRTLKAIRSEYALTVEGGGKLTVNNPKGDAVVVNSFSCAAPLRIEAKGDALRAAGDMILNTNALTVSAGGKGLYSQNGNITVRADELAVVTTGTALEGVNISLSCHGSITSERGAGIEGLNVVIADVPDGSTLYITGNTLGIDAVRSITFRSGPVILQGNTAAVSTVVEPVSIESPLMITSPAGGRAAGQTIVDANGSTARSVRVGLPPITGSVQIIMAASPFRAYVGYPLRAELSGAPASATVQWQRSANGASFRDLPGATGLIYTPTSADETQTLLVRVTAPGYEGSLVDTVFVPASELLDHASFTSLTTTLTPGEPAAADGVASPGRYTLLRQEWRLAGASEAYTGNVEAGKNYVYHAWFQPAGGSTFGDAGALVPVYLNGEKIGKGAVVIDAGAALLHFTLAGTVADTMLVTVTLDANGGRFRGDLDLDPVRPPRLDGGAEAPAQDGLDPFQPGKPLETSLPVVTPKPIDFSTSTITKTVTVDQPYGKLREPEREGYVFDGWYTEKSGGTLVTAETVCTKTVDHTLYAHWKEDALAPVSVPYTGNIFLTGFVEPVAGEAISSSVISTSEACSVVQQGWGDAIVSAEPLTDTVFRAGKTYYWTCLVRLNDGMIFPEDYAGSITLNGKKLTPMSAEELTAALQAGEPICMVNSIGETDMLIALSFTPPEPAKPSVKLSSDVKSAKAENFDGLYARVALVLDNNGVSGLYVTQASINTDGTVVIPSFMVPGLTVKGINIALVPTLADISSPQPNVKASDFKML